MPGFGRFLPFRDLLPWNSSAVRPDILASLTIIFMAVPQGVAYAMIAGLPPAMGLYAATIPAILGSLLRSSRHVIAGPTNALSLLIGGAVAVHAELDPVVVAVTLALMVGVMQISAGFLRLGAIVDFISKPVVAGYITGAAVLIGVGQLPNLSQTPGARGTLWNRLAVWVDGLSAASSLAIGVGLGTLVTVVILRRLAPKLPSPMIAMSLATFASWYFGFQERGLWVVADLSPVPSGLPPLSLPDFGLMPELVALAVAATVLSLVESSAVARSIAAQSGQKLDADVEFAGQGWSNLSAAFFSGYPVSGSLSRSALNAKAGGQTRLAGVHAGVMMIIILLALGDVVNFTPVAALAGLLLVVAWDLVDLPVIRSLWRASLADRLTFIITTAATWLLSLDQAIYVGVAISLAMVLRRARLVTACELGLDHQGNLEESPLEDASRGQCSNMRIIQLEGRLFFAAEGDLRRLFTSLSSDKTLVVRMRRTQGMDATIATTLAEISEASAHRGQRIVYCGLPTTSLEVMRRSGAAERIGEQNLFEGTAKRLQALQQALAEVHGASHDGDCVAQALIRRTETT